MTIGFDIEEEPGDGVTHLRPSGELDLATEERLRRRLRELEARRAAVALDLSGLTFMDSTGVRLLLDACLRSRRDGWRLVVSSPSPAVQRVLEITGVSSLVLDGAPAHARR